jgi:uncharacterized membrane protein HdeD (DUF308 family)
MGIVTAALGVFLIVYPLATATITTLVGVSVLMSGISRIMIATKIRSGAAEVERFVRAA